MNIYYVGSAVDSNTLTGLEDASVAGNKMQLGFVKGFQQNGAVVHVISVEPYQMWHFNKKPIFVKGKKLQDKETAIQTTSYLNLPGLKQLIVMHNLYKYLMNCKIEKNDIVMVYNTMTMFALPVLKFVHKKMCVGVSIVADLPIRGNKSFLRKIEDRLQEKWISSFDKIIPLTQQIAKDFAPNTPYIVIEAGCNLEEYEAKKVSERKQIRDPKTIVFSGTLNEMSGIKLILETMKVLPLAETVLCVYGDGEYRNDVEDMASSNSNILYCGKVSNQEMLKIQSDADLLVCPRSADDYTTKYTFPSKVLEYLCSGTPVLMNRLEGIPDEYTEYVNYAGSCTSDDWAQAICEILGRNNLQYVIRAHQSREKVLSTKNWKNQCAKVIPFLESNLKQ